MGALLHPGHRASLVELEDLFDAALRAAVARICDRAQVQRLEIHINWDSSERWGVRAQSTAEQVAVVGSVAPPLSSAHWWHKPVIITFESADSVSHASLSLPWLLNHDAWADAETSCQLGGAEGLYFGGVRVPSITAALKPGLHRLAGREATRDLNPDNVDLSAWDLQEDTLRASKQRLSAVLVPDLGDIVPISLGSRRGKRFTRTSERLARLLDGTDSDRILLPDTASTVLDLLNVDGGLADDKDFADVLEDWLRGDADVPDGIEDAPVRPTDRMGSRLRFWGHSLAYALHRGIRRSERLLAQRIESGAEAEPTPRVVSDALAWGLGNAVKQLLVGSDTYAGLHRLVDNTSTLSRIESFRQVSFYGPGALKEVRNRLDLRDLDDDWRRLLCPLQTPESTKVGLVRYLAAAEGADEIAGAGQLVDEWGDLSLSACLIPFIDCDDAAKSSTGAKNLKQAVPVLGAAPPRVRTGWENRLAELAGVSRSPVDGEFVTSTEFDTVVRKGRREYRVAFGAGWSPSAGPCRAWVQAGTDTDLAKGDLIALAPDVVTLSGGQPSLSLGVDALVALTPWFGLNHEDGIVVSESYAAKLASRERVVARERYDAAVDGEVRNLLAQLGGDLEVEPRRAIVAIEPKTSGEPRTVIAPVAGVLVDVRCVDGMVEVAIDVDRPLQVGDKLTNRHGGKGVVCAILPDADMPRIGSARGDVVDAILNPLGVLRRLNIGQLWEMHTSLAARLAGIESVIVGRRPEDPAKLAKKLAKLGAPDGRMPLLSASGSRLDHGDGVVVGEQYLLKLDHLAVNKARARAADSPRSPRSLQPSRRVDWKLGKRGAAAQRLGEMELWALTALDLRELLNDVVDVRGRVGKTPDPAGVKPTLLAVAAHLAVAGLQVKAIVDGKAVDALHAVEPADIVRIEVDHAWPHPREVDSEFLTEIATTRFVRTEQEHPLYDKRHGTTRGARERVRWAIRLPFPVPHPWDTNKVSLPPIDRVPILPPALRAFGQDGLDTRYAALAAAVRGFPAGSDPVASGWADRVSTLVDGIVGRSMWVDQMVRAGGRSWTVFSGPDDEDQRPVVEDLVGTDEFFAATPVVAPPRGRGAAAIDPETTIAGRLRDKKGLLRRSLLGHAVQRSGRAVIVGDPDRDPQTIGIPEVIYETIVDAKAKDEYRDVVILNRQPTLRPNAMLALRSEPVPGDALLISPAILDCLAGDFDGDTAAVHWPANESARREAWEYLRPARQLRNYGTPDGLLPKLELDAALGLLIATDTPAKRRKLPAALGQGTLVLARPLDSEGISDFVAEVVSKLDQDEVVTALARGLKIGATHATGFSLGALELLDVKSVEQIKGASRSSGPAEKRLKQLLDVKAADDAVLTQLLVTRGSVDTGRDDMEADTSVQGRYLVGLTPAEAYLAARGGILKLATKKLLTPFAGDLTKQLVEIGYEVAVDAKDCAAPGPRDPLHCLRPVPYLCAACTSQWSPRPGAALGVLAGMVIGQRSTQLALKSNRASSKSPELEQIAAVFGTGGIPWPESIPRERRDELVRRRLEEARSRAGGRRLSKRTQAELVVAPITLAELLAGVEETGSALAAAVEPALHVFNALFKASVHEFWAQILLRQIWAAGRGRTEANARTAMYSGKGALSAATVRGNLNRLVELSSTAKDAKAEEAHRTALLLGAWK